MKKLILLFDFCILTFALSAQSVTAKLATAYKQFENDPQLKHAISSLHVIDAKTGKVVFSKNAQIGLVPASTQKIITAATAFELLGKDYRYKTELGYDGTIKENRLDGNLYITGTGDPTLGSWRWPFTQDSSILKKWVNEIKKLKIDYIDGRIEVDDSKFTYNGIPDGWIWQDIGNYYGAGSYSLNWKENQFDLKLASEASINSAVKILNKESELPYDYRFHSNELKAAAKGTGDNAYIYYNNSIAGTIPIGEKSFTISGALKDPKTELLRDLMHFMWNEIPTNFLRDYYSEEFPGPTGVIKKFYTNYSPSLDSIVYWFLQKSINLYGEALIKTFAYEKQGFGSTDSGVSILKKFWKEKGIDDDELGMVDGSGLSPVNRVTTHSQVEVLKYAKKQSWFTYFYNALPDYNNMKMKSGTIKGVKGYSGYHTSRSGQEYIFSFLVNNYSGSHSSLVNKMYRVLNVLK